MNLVQNVIGIMKRFSMFRKSALIGTTEVFKRGSPSLLSVNFLNFLAPGILRMEQGLRYIFQTKTGVDGSEQDRLKHF